MGKHFSVITGLTIVCTYTDRHPRVFSRIAQGRDWIPAQNRCGNDDTKARE